MLMPEYYVLVKPRKAKKWQGAIPARKGVSKARLQKAVRSQIRKGMSYRIVTKTQLATYLKTQLKKSRSSPRRKVRRKSMKKKAVRRKRKSR